MTAGQIPTVTLPALPAGVQSMNLYVTNANCAAGTETLYATGITTTTFACSYAAPPDQPTESLPEINSTGWPSSANLLATQANTELALRHIFEKLSQFCCPAPPFNDDGFPRHDSARWASPPRRQGLDRGHHADLGQLALGIGRSTRSRPLDCPSTKWILP